MRFLPIFCLFFLSGCVQTIRTHGFPGKGKEIAALDGRVLAYNDVCTRVGPAPIRSVFDPNTFYYVTQRTGFYSSLFQPQVLYYGGYVTRIAPQLPLKLTEVQEADVVLVTPVRTKTPVYNPRSSWLAGLLGNFAQTKGGGEKL